MEKMMPLARKAVGLPLPAVAPGGTRLAWLPLALLAAAVILGGPAMAQDLSPIDSFFATRGAALTGTTGRSASSLSRPSASCSSSGG